VSGGGSSPRRSAIEKGLRQNYAIDATYPCTDRGSPMTTYESTTVWLAILQLLISTLGFVVVAWTLRVLVRQIDGPSSAGVATRQLEFDKVILAHPRLYKYFYNGQDIASDDPEYPRVMAAAQLLANYFDGYFQQEGMYRQMWPDSKWKGYIHDHVTKSPALRRYVVANATWFAHEFVQLCNRAERSAPSKALHQSGAP
jgi:hypothetical protein